MSRTKTTTVQDLDYMDSSSGEEDNVQQDSDQTILSKFVNKDNRYLFWRKFYIMSSLTVLSILILLYTHFGDQIGVVTPPKGSPDVNSVTFPPEVLDRDLETLRNEPVQVNDKPIEVNISELEHDENTDKKTDRLADSSNKLKEEPTIDLNKGQTNEKNEEEEQIEDRNEDNMDEQNEEKDAEQIDVQTEDETQDVLTETSFVEKITQSFNEYKLEIQEMIAESFEKFSVDQKNERIVEQNNFLSQVTTVLSGFITKLFSPITTEIESLKSNDEMLGQKVDKIQVQLNNIESILKTINQRLSEKSSEKPQKNKKNQKS